MRPCSAAGQAVLREFVAHPLQLFELAAEENRHRAQRGHFVRGAAADAGTGAGDDDDLAVEELRPQG